MSSFDFINTPLMDLKVILRKKLEDHRGYLSRFYCADEFISAGVNKTIAQINHTLTKAKGTIRGLHFQYLPYTEVKLVSCLKGEIWDVAVDLRCNSPTFLQWHGEILTADNCKSLLIPEGFAHGFQTLSQDCELIYLHTEKYQSESEGALNVLDPSLNIDWPLPIGELSDRDRKHPFIDKTFQGLTL